MPRCTLKCRCSPSGPTFARILPYARSSACATAVRSLLDVSPSCGPLPLLLQPMIGEKQVRIERRFGDQLVAEVADAGSAVEQEQTAAAAHFDRGSVASIARRPRARARDAAAHAPESNAEIVGLHPSTI